MSIPIRMKKQSNIKNITLYLKYLKLCAVKFKRSNLIKLVNFFKIYISHAYNIWYTK